MLYCSMNYILENWEDAMTDCAWISATEYGKSNLIVEKWLNLCLKYEHTQDNDLLKRGVQEISEIFSKEKSVWSTLYTMELIGISLIRNIFNDLAY